MPTLPRRLLDARPSWSGHPLLAAFLVSTLSLWSCSQTPPASIAAPANPGDATASIRFDGLAYRGGVVAVANPNGAEAGAEILRRGGNAVDAAVAIAYALNVVEPQSAGIGGGGFMMIHRAATGDTVIVDSRETAPAAATPDLFVGVPEPSRQGVAVGVPGMVRGTDLALHRYGTRSLARVLEPAIRLAEGGFAATPDFLANTNCNNPNSRALNSPAVAEYFCPGGKAREPGSWVTNPSLAHTLRLIAQHGADCFYRLLPDTGCDIALGIVTGQRFSRELPLAGVPTPGKGGGMTLADLEAYQPVVRAPIEGRYRGYRIQAMPPPSSGGLTVLQILGMLERFPLGDTGAGFGFGAPQTLNVMADAMRLAFADRAVWMGDADFVPVPSRGLLAPAYLAPRAALLQPGVRAPDAVVVAADPRPFEVPGTAPGTRLPVADPVTGPEKGTTHFSVIDPWGNWVSYTNTIEAAYGIGVFAAYQDASGEGRDFGFLLNNELTDFNLAPSINPYTAGPGYNDIAPGKRPRSSMSPLMLFTPDGQPLAAYGSPGGPTIISAVLNVTLNLIDHRMTPQQAIDAPRLSASSTSGYVLLEPAVPQEVLEAMSDLGYNLVPGVVGAVQAVLFDPETGHQYGAADGRREGTVIGLP